MKAGILLPLYHDIKINEDIENHEVPDIREAIGWTRRDEDYPILFGKCLFWAGSRNNEGMLIAFGYVAGPGIEHGYLEDVIVHPDYQGKGIGKDLVQRLLQEAGDRGISIVTVTYHEKHTNFYKVCGFTPCPGAIWRKK